MEEQILNTVAKYTTGRKNCEELTKELLILFSVSNPVCFECGEEINPEAIFFCTKCDVNNQIKANGIANI